MKIVKIVISITIAIISGYLLYRLFAVDLFINMDYLLLIVLLLAGLVNLFLNFLLPKTNKL
jgi:hypothetical protein